MNKVLIVFVLLIMMLNISEGYTFTLKYETETATMEVDAGETLEIGLPDRSLAKYIIDKGSIVLKTLGNRRKFVMPAEDVEISVRKAGVETYKVTFECNGGFPIDNKEVVYGETYKDLEVPVRESYVFLGWYKEPELINKVSGNSIVSIPRNHTLYAKWQTVWDAGIILPNSPKLGVGMEAVNWNGSEWVTANEVSWEWDYNSVAEVFSNGTVAGNGYGKWANARTEDGSMYVWIPRFSYRIVSGEHQTVKPWNSDLVDGSEGTLGKIEIKFSVNSIDYENDGFALHPAFKFGDEEITGFWIAKYEASRNDATDTLEGSGTIPTSKPSVRSWRNTSASNMYINAKNLNPSLESHMIRNSEWGAVVYLTNAIGRNPYINNDANFVTGKVGGIEKDVSTTGTYWTPDLGSGTKSSAVAYEWNTVNGVKGSTTHNVYGIYDMSGGVHEATTALLSNGTATYLGNDTSNTYCGAIYRDKDTKYVEKYTGFSSTVYGDAVYETSLNQELSTWGSSRANWMSAGAPVLVRGVDSVGYTSSGIYGYSCFNGGSDTNCGFRVTLIP